MVDGSKRLEKLLRHVNNVQENTLRLGETLIEKGEEELGRELIVNGRCHDSSKFKGIEWEYFDAEVKNEKPELFKAAWYQHVKTNPHHPEYHRDGIKGMGDLYLAELSCDWLARSTEFGDDIWGWIKEEGAERYSYSTSSSVYKKIKSYLEMILEPAFK